MEMAEDFNPHTAYKIPVLPSEKVSKARAAKTNKDLTGASTPVHYVPVVTKYHADNAWGTLEATVTDNHDNYNIKVISSNPAEKWILKDITNQTIVAQGGENMALNFMITMNQPWKNNLGLSVMILADGQDVSALLPLTNQK